MNGAIVWFTGLPASGKSTLAARLRDRIPHVPSVLLDGDVVRELLGVDTYEAGDRDALYRVIAGLATTLADQGLVVLVAATAPRRAHRELARGSIRFLEVFVATPLETCEQRDVKQLYARARAGNAPNLPGVGVPYEPPLAPDVIAAGGFDDTALAQLERLVVT